MTNLLEVPTWLIYHPPRKKTKVGNYIVHHDKFSSNQDPYIWNNPFLHSFCHITQLSNKQGQINFWISRDEEDKYPYFSKLHCDLVFVVKTIHEWTQPNFINRHNKIVDNNQAFKHHYNWVNPPHSQHHFKGTKRQRTRYTLKADNRKSFQPLHKNGKLIDILPFLNDHGIKTETLQDNMTLTKNGKAARPSRPYQLDSTIGQKLYEYLKDNASIKLIGSFLADKYPNPQ